MKEEHPERHSLYESGLTDNEIAHRLGVTQIVVRFWRRRHGLPANAGTPRPFDTTPMRRLLHDLGWGHKSIARYQGVSVCAVREWRARWGAEPSVQPKQRNAEQRQQQLQDLQKRVVKAVGCRLPFDIAADAAAELMLAVIEGTVPLNQIEKYGREFGNRALNEYANPFTTRSLDADLPDYEGLRPIDRLADESASTWLEEMGATVH